MTGRSTAIARAKIVRAVLLDFGAPEVSIEPQAGRPGPSDPWNSYNFVAPLSHHIASRPTVASPTPGLALVKRGRSDLPGPLCNGTAGVDLVYRIICLGYANHPGTGGPLTLNGPMGRVTIPRDNGRAYLWGTEYEGGYDNATWDRVYTNRRTGTSMTFREFMGRCNAGLAHAVWYINNLDRVPDRHIDMSSYHGEHKTWAPGRKPDRLNYTTTSGRAEASRYTQEDDVAAKDVWEHPIETKGDDPKKIPAGVMLAQAHRRAADARANADAALDQAQRNRAAIKAMAERLDQIAPGIAAEVVKALGNKVVVDVNVRAD